MNKSLKKIAVVAAIIAAVGLVLTGIGYLLGGNQHIYLDKNGIHVGEREGGRSDRGDLVSFSESVEGFGSISVELDYYDVDLIPSDKFAVEGAYLSEDGQPEIKVENDTLVVNDTWNQGVKLNIDLSGFAFQNDQPHIKIYYPVDTKLKDVVIRSGAADLDFEGVTADNAEFDLDFGKLELTDINADRITVDMDSGDCTMKKIKAADSLTVTNQFGKTTLDGAEMKTLKIDADSGDVALTDAAFDKGDLRLSFGKLTAKGTISNGLKAESDSGDIDLQGKLLGLTEVTCNMGKVTLKPGAPKDQFNYEFNTDMGSVSVEGDRVSGSMAVNNASAQNTLKVTTDMGDISIIFD
jgi:hypothetical protein